MRESDTDMPMNQLYEGVLQEEEFKILFHFLIRLFFLFISILISF